jgi:transposase
MLSQWSVTRLHPRGGYSANSYLEILDDQLPQIYEPGMTFMQDNASIHTAKRVKAWFEEHGVAVIDWPPYSPDMNPIEHAWHLLKSWLQINYPELKEMGKGQADQLAWKQAIIEGWASIDQQVLDNLLGSMQKRCQALVDAKGWHTKY